MPTNTNEFTPEELALIRDIAWMWQAELDDTVEDVTRDHIHENIEDMLSSVAELTEQKVLLGSILGKLEGRCEPCR